MWETSSRLVAFDAQDWFGDPAEVAAEDLHPLLSREICVKHLGEQGRRGKHDGFQNCAAVGVRHGVRRFQKYFSTIHFGCHWSGLRRKSSKRTSLGCGISTESGC